MDSARKPGKPIDLKRGRVTRLPRMGLCIDEGKLKEYLKDRQSLIPCELRIVVETRDGKQGVRVYWPDGVEIEHFVIQPNERDPVAQ